MNKNGELKITGLLIGLITAFGLFFGLIGYTMMNLNSGYDITGYDNSSISKYNYLDKMSNNLSSTKDTIENVQVESNVFDWFAGIWNKFTQPFRLIYRSYDNLISATDDSISDLQLPPIYRVYFSTAIIILVVVGIVMIKFYLGRN